MTNKDINTLVALLGKLSNEINQAQVARNGILPPPALFHPQLRVVPMGGEMLVLSFRPEHVVAGDRLTKETVLDMDLGNLKSAYYLLCRAEGKSKSA